MLKELQLIGLNKNEAKVYEALAKLGPCKAGLIIAKLDVHRNLVYQSLESLTLKGYSTKVIKRGVWHFQITDPKSLLTGLRQKENILSQVIKQIQTLQHKTNQQIVVYEGIDSFRSYWTSSLERMPDGTVDYIAGGLGNKKWIALLGDSYKRYLELRLKKKIQWKAVLFKVTESQLEMLQEYPKLTEFRLWPKDAEPLGNFNVIYDTVILQIVTEPPRIIEIRDKDMVKMFKSFFDMLWEKSKPVKV